MTFLVALLFLAQSVPDTLTLGRAYQLASENNPLHMDLSTRESMYGLRVKNLNVNYLPSVSFTGQATYHSDVANVNLPGSSSAIFQPSQDQYKVAAGIDQLVFDGGVTAGLKALEAVERDLEMGKVEIELYKLREQVNAAYFGVLIFDSHIATLGLLQEDLRARLRTVQSLADNGVVLRSNADVLAAELIEVRQQIIEARSNRDAALGILSELTGTALGSQTVLEEPHITTLVSPRGRARPEYAVYDANREALSRRATLVTRRQMPHVSVFGETAYGRPPGLNFIETDFKPFYTAGLRISWNPWSWNRSRRERRLLELEGDLVEAQEGAFSQRQRVAIQQDLADIRKYEALLEQDQAVVELRERIADQAASQLDNGVITSTDYLTERNAASRASLTYRLHQIQLSQAKARYLTTIGE